MSTYPHYLPQPTFDDVVEAFDFLRDKMYKRSGIGWVRREKMVQHLPDGSASAPRLKELRFQYKKAPYKIWIDPNHHLRVYVPYGRNAKGHWQHAMLARDGSLYSKNDLGNPDVLWHPKEHEALWWVLETCGLAKLKNTRGRIRGICRYCPNQLMCLSEPVV